MNYCLFVLVESSSVKIACRYGCPFFMYWATIVWLLVGRCMVMSSLWELPVRLTQIFGLVSSLSLFIAWTYLSCIFFGELNEEWTKCAYKGIKNSTKKAPQCLQENVGAPRFSGLKIVPIKHKNRGDWVKQRNKWLNGDTKRKWILLWWLNVRWEEDVVGPSGAWDAPEFAHWWTMFCWLDDVAEVKEIYEVGEIPNSSGRMIAWNLYRFGNRYQLIVWILMVEQIV